MNKYEVQGVGGEGTYGVVLKCLDKEKNEIVAIKKFKENDEAVRKTTIRELKLLRMIKHKCIVNLIEAFRRNSKLYLVFEYVEMNILQLLEKNADAVAPSMVRKLIFQLCLAVDCCHKLNVIHRDIKPENLLVDSSCNLKLCDFGFARSFTPGPTHESFTDYVATRWYRAPELLVGSNDYDTKVDIWAIGCIMGELIDGQPMFPGDGELDQIFLIQKLIGPLTPFQLKRFQRNPRFHGIRFPPITGSDSTAKRYCGRASKKGISFLNACLEIDPATRLSAEQLIMHEYFDDIRPDFMDEFRDQLQPIIDAFSSKKSHDCEVMAVDEAKLDEPVRPKTHADYPPGSFGVQPADDKGKCDTPFSKRKGKKRVRKEKEVEGQHSRKVTDIDIIPLKGMVKAKEPRRTLVDATDTSSEDFSPYQLNLKTRDPHDVDSLPSSKTPKSIVPDIYIPHTHSKSRLAKVAGAAQVDKGPPRIRMPDTPSMLPSTYTNTRPSQSRQSVYQSGGCVPLPSMERQSLISSKADESRKYKPKPIQFPPQHVQPAAVASEVIDTPTSSQFKLPATILGASSIVRRNPPVITSTAASVMVLGLKTHEKDERSPLMLNSSQFLERLSPIHDERMRRR